MTHHEASVEVSAEPARVWDVLVDVASWPRWDSGVDRVEGTVAPGGSRVVVREEYTGVLAPVVTRSIPDLTASFEQFVSGLRARVETAG